MTGCVTTGKTEIVLPPKPERQELPKVETVKDYALVINYYEHLLREWESWGQSVTGIVEDRNRTGSVK